MKRPTKHLTQNYPYLAYWIADWGEMETTSGDWGNPRIRLIDMGGTCYEDYTSENHEDALQNAENYLRKVDFPARFDKETIASLEEDYSTFKLK
jgi:hypothetical protein